MEYREIEQGEYWPDGIRRVLRVVQEISNFVNNTLRVAVVLPQIF